jgi:hypothetical protein
MKISTAVTRTTDKRVAFGFLKMEAICFSETSDSLRATQQDNPEDRDLQHDNNVKTKTT